MSQRGKLTSVSYSPVRIRYSCQEKSALLSSWKSHLFIWIKELQAAGRVHRLHTGLANGESLKTVLNWHKNTHRGYLQFSWVSQSCLTLQQQHGLQQAMPSCPSPTPGACSYPCPSSQRCHNHLILCSPLLLPPTIFPRIRIFSNESVLCIRWPKYWSFSISTSNECSGLISFWMDLLDLAVQGTLKSLLQHHSSKASILLHSAFFIV